jgi:hypothetical protein
MRGPGVPKEHIRPHGGETMTGYETFIETAVPQTSSTSTA